MSRRSRLRPLPVAAARRGATRDRHGRGLRGPRWLPGPLSPTASELLPTRRAAFDEIVLSLVDRLTARYGEELKDVEFGTQDVPHLSDTWSEPVPCGSLVLQASDQPARVVIFRRPIEAKATSRSELIALTHRQVVELVAELLGRSPDDLDDLTGPGGLEN